MKNSFKTFAALVALVIAIPAFALDLGEARTKGMVIEQPSGYLTAAVQTGEVDALVKDVNARRKTEYERISKENGQPVDVVAKLAAEQIRKKMGK